MKEPYGVLIKADFSRPSPKEEPTINCFSFDGVLAGIINDAVNSKQFKSEEDFLIDAVRRLKDREDQRNLLKHYLYE